MVTHQATRSRDADLDRVLHALADPSRRRILDLLAREDLPVNRIAERFDISRPAVIKHLHVLRAAKLVSVRAKGRERIQCLDTQPLRKVDAWLARFESFWDDSLRELKRRAERES